MLLDLRVGEGRMGRDRVAGRRIDARQHGKLLLDSSFAQRRAGARVSLTLLARLPHSTIHDRRPTDRGFELRGSAARTGGDRLQARKRRDAAARRSEEHTSELQSLMRISYA